MSEAPKKYTFLLYAPDLTDPEAFKRRLTVRQEHMANGKGLIDKGIIRLGGAMISPETYQNPDMQKVISGSLMVYEAESLEAVRELVENDVYYKTNVWDKEKLTITPWISAVPLPAMSL